MFKNNSRRKGVAGRALPVLLFESTGMSIYWLLLFQYDCRCRKFICCR